MEDILCRSGSAMNGSLVMKFPDVSSDSKTPYTDATSLYVVRRRTKHSSGDSTRSTASGQSTSSGRSSGGEQERIKRPMNAFMIWSQIQRRSMLLSNDVSSGSSRSTVTSPRLHNAVISRQLGRLWNDLTDEQRQPYIDEAFRLRRSFDHCTFMHILHYLLTAG